MLSTIALTAMFTAGIVEHLLSGRLIGLWGRRVLPQRGHVVALGPGKLLENGSRAGMSVAVGDEVIYGKYSGSDIEMDGREVKILREGDILARLTK